MAPTFHESWLWKYGFLMLLISLTAWSLRLLPDSLSSGAPAPFSILFVMVLMLLGHVRASFIPPGRLATWCQGLVLAWAVFTLAYVFTSGFSGFPVS